MIEVEKKFFTSKPLYDFVYQQCEFEGERVIEDVYYDTPDFNLMLANTWLRNRNGAWELKVPTPDFSPEVTSYEELEDAPSICRHVGIPGSTLSFDILKEYGYVPVVEFQSTRKKFRHGEFLIDIDETTFDLELCEIELMVAGVDDIEAAQRKIIEFARSIDPELRETHVGKVRYFLITKYPEIDAQLVASGICHPLEL